MTDAELGRIRAQLGENMNAVCTGCGYCKDCPQGIPVAAYMQVYNDRVMFGADDNAMRKSIGSNHEWGILAIREGDAGECIECGQCEDACTQHLPITERLKDIARWEAQL